MRARKQEPIPDIGVRLLIAHAHAMVPPAICSADLLSTTVYQHSHSTDGPFPQGSGIYNSITLLSRAIDLPSQ